MSSLTRPSLFAPLLGTAALATSIHYAGYRLAGSDAGALLTAAAKILRGGVFYRDIDSYAFPGAAYLLALAMRIFGESVTVARGLAALLFCVTILALYYAAVRLLGPGRAATFGASLLAFKLVAWPSFTAYYYWDVAFAFGCVTAALIGGHPFRGASLRLALAGLATGLAVAAKQSLGIPLAGAVLAVLLAPGPIAGVVRERPRDRLTEIATFALAASLPILGMTAYFATQGLLWEMIESGLLRPFSTYLPTSSTSYLEPLAWWRLGELRELAGLPYSSEPVWTLLTQEELPGHRLYPFFWLCSEIFSRLVYTSVPLCFGAVLWIRFRPSEATGARALLLYAPIAAAIFLSAFPRADFTHVISVYPVVLLLLFALLGHRGLARPTLERIATGAALALCIALTAIQHAELTHRLELDRASLWISPRKSWIESAIRFVSEEVAVNEAFFVYGHEAYYYFLSDRYSPWPYSQLYPGQAGGDGGRALVAALQQAKPPRVLRGAIRFPRVTPIPEYAPHLHRYIEREYEPDAAVFEKHPPASGELPLPRQFQMLRRGQLSR